MFELRNLGWNSFQQLCLTIAREVLGQTVESFLDSNDGGRDGAFTGTWKPTGQENQHGQFVIQCKFTSRLNHVICPSDLKDEANKAKRLVEKGYCDSYILMTNAGLSGTKAEDIECLFRNAGVKYFNVFGASWIDQQIRENKNLRMLVPRVYGLGDLSQILDERAYAQAHAILESLREDLAKVVVTDAYRKAITSLDKYGFVLLTGEPAVGKTTIASMLAMAAIDNWNASILKLDDPKNTIEHWNPSETTQFFWIDDAFGVSQYEIHLVHSWNHILPQMNSMLRKGAKIVMTSRDYIYHRARKDLKESAFPLLQERQVVIDVHDLSTDEKRQILYNHLKLGGQPNSFRAQIKPYLEMVALHNRFIPETARRLSNPFFTKNLNLNKFNLDNFVEKREVLLKEILQGLDQNSKAALGLVFMRNDHLESPIGLQLSEEHAIKRLGSNLGDCLTALEALDGSLVQYSREGDNPFWRFKHPTIGDTYSTIIVESPELIGIYLKGIATEKLIQQVTCGNVGIEKAVVIPPGLFPEVMAKLQEFLTTKNIKNKRLSVWQVESMVQRFLTHRCSKEFLSYYLEEHIYLLDKVAEPGLYLNSVSEVDLAVRLFDLGLLPEEKRVRFINTVADYAIQGEDLYALYSANIKHLFADHEFVDLLKKVHNQLIPRLDDVRKDIEENYQSNETSEEHMQRFLDNLEILKKHFGNDFQTNGIIEEQMDLVNDWISENTVEEPDFDIQALGNIDAQEPGVLSRSVFDDIDA
jgi:energy-coupling factor transporter ATP-binding protein EcfA2